MQFRTTPYAHQLKEYNETKDREAWGLYSMRSWGGVLAEIWSEVDKEDYMYMDFYMGQEDFNDGP